MKIERATSHAHHPLHELASVIVSSKAGEVFSVRDLPIEYAFLSSDSFKDVISAACYEIVPGIAWGAQLGVETIGSGRMISGYTITLRHGARRPV